MPRRPEILLAQLPIPQAAALCGTGNVPLAAGSLAVAARRAGFGARLDVDILPPSVTDVLGDALLVDLVARRAPAFLGLSLYLWNVERSLHLAREVKKRSPATTVLIGGPEVGPDNPFVLAQDGWDVAVTGEAEADFPALLEALLAGRSPEGSPGVAVRRGGVVSAWGPPPRVDFPLRDAPSPYLDGTLPVEPRRSVYLETVRGCRSHCTFCFYPRVGGELRTLPGAEGAALVAAVRARGAKDVTFLDPTFNHSPEFEALLDGLIEVNRDHAMTFFAEIRAEGLTDAHADKLAAAGFTKLEIGLQSVNPRTLKTTKRGGDPEKVAAVAKKLHARGIRLLVDLIVGLPGDGPDDVARGVDFLRDHGLGDEAQVFPLFLLPGTAMRADAAKDGVEFEAAPPYRVLRTPTFDEAALRASLLAAEDRLERRLDETPRPLLADPDPAVDPPDVLRLDLDRGDAAARERAARPAARHVALWLEGEDLFAARGAALRAVEARLAVDPYATLDVVLAPRRPFPFDLLDALKRLFDAATPSYQSRSLALRGENAQRRLAVVLRPDVRVPRDWGLAVSDLATVWRDQSFAAALAAAEAHGDGRPGARILDGPPPSDARAWRDLFERCDPDAVAFADRSFEERWIAALLGHRPPTLAPL